MARRVAHRAEAALRETGDGAVITVFGQTTDYDFVNFDDHAYVYENRHVMKGLTNEGVVWSLTAFHSTAPDNQETSGVRPKLDSWWTDFRDGLLTQTIQEALAQNLDLAASLDRVEQARAAARE